MRLKSVTLCAMTYEILTGLVGFAFVTSITPGPNNLMLMTSGANFGFLKTIPHMLGIGIGFTVMVALVGFGLMQVFDIVPYSHEALTGASILYLIWLAWKFANAGEPEAQNAAAKPMTFTQAAAFQWVNPKAWYMALSAITLYAPERDAASVLLVAMAFGAVNLPCVSSWTVLGQQMRRFLTSPLRLKVFNYTMAALLLASALPALFQ